MANPNVDKLTAEVSKVLERWFDRCQDAVAAARNGCYSYQQFARDMTETWVDGSYIAVFPVTLFNGITVTLNQPFPCLCIKLCTRSDTSRVLSVSNLPTGPISSEDLTDSFGNKIPAANVTLTKGVGSVTVALKVSALAIPGGVYKGRILDSTTGSALAQIVVELP
jgi:hypothetical protein